MPFDLAFGTEILTRYFVVEADAEYWSRAVGQVVKPALSSASC